MSRAEALEQGIEQGKAVALRQRVRHLCTKLDIKLTDSRQLRLDAPETDLEALLDGLALEHCWPE